MKVNANQPTTKLADTVRKMKAAPSKRGYTYMLTPKEHTAMKIEAIKRDVSMSDLLSEWIAENCKE